MLTIDALSTRLPAEQQTAVTTEKIGEASHLWEGDVGSFNALSFELVSPGRQKVTRPFSAPLTECLATLRCHSPHHSHAV